MCPAPARTTAAPTPSRHRDPPEKSPPVAPATEHGHLLGNVRHLLPVPWSTPRCPPEVRSRSHRRRPVVPRTWPVDPSPARRPPTPAARRTPWHRTRQAPPTRLPCHPLRVSRPAEPRAPTVERSSALAHLGPPHVSALAALSVCVSPSSTSQHHVPP